MATLPEIAAEMLVWIQIHNAERDKLSGVGKDVRDFAERRVRELLEQARFQTR